MPYLLTPTEPRVPSVTLYPCLAAPLRDLAADRIEEGAR